MQLADRARTFINEAVPRYTSYPPATEFQASFDPAEHAGWLAAVPPGQPLSVYIHIPYCDRLCWFCGCTTKQTRRYDPVAAYLQVLHQEIAGVAQHLRKGQGANDDAKPRIARLHLGGGSPSLLHAEDMRALRACLDEHFEFERTAEISVELDPVDMTPASYGGLMDLGLNRASLGVQDFDTLVQTAINRPQSFEDTKTVIDRLRALGVPSVNIDALYGLPHQTQQRFAATLEQIISLKPERIALFGYAHVPWVKKHQRLIPPETLPGPEERLTEARYARQRLIEAGYEAIGIDHFAVPSDSLAVAARRSQVYRNFQGYTTDPCPTLIGLGPSAISRFHQGYVQNSPATDAYTRAIQAGQLASSRGLALSNEDRLYGWAIERLMCDFKLRYTDLLEEFGPSAAPLIAHLDDLAAGALSALCSSGAGELTLTETDGFAARVVASRIDRYYNPVTERFSNAV